MKRRFSRMFMVVLICSNVLTTSALGYKHEKEAEVLYNLGLYKGVSEVAYVPDLGSKLTREQAAVILIRLFGEQDKASKMTNSKVNKALKKFVDADDISSWAKKEVAYAASKGYVKGIEQSDGFYFNPKGYLKGIDYASLVLQRLNITDFEYEKALTKLKDEGIISKEVTFNKNQLTRDDVVFISYGVLGVQNENGKTVIENLIDLGQVKKDDAEKYGLIKKEKNNKDTNQEQDTSTKEQNDDKDVDQGQYTDTKEQDNQNQDTEKQNNQDQDKNEQNTNNLKRAEGAVKLGQWTLYNKSREAINVDKIYLSADYGGNPYILNPAHVTNYSIEDTNGNVYATFSNLSETRQVSLQKPFVIDEMEDNIESKKDMVVYAKINENATYGGTIELFLGDGANIFEATGKITGTSVKKIGDRIEQEDGKLTIVMSEVVPNIASYNTQPVAGNQITVGAFYLENRGSKGVLVEKITLVEKVNTSNNVSYVLKNDKGEVISQAISNEGSIVFEIEKGQKISAGISERFEVQVNNRLEKYDRIELRLIKEGTNYDTLDNKGYSMNIDDDLTLDAVVVKD